MNDVVTHEEVLLSQQGGGRREAPGLARVGADGTVLRLEARDYVDPAYGLVTLVMHTAGAAQRVEDGEPGGSSRLVDQAQSERSD